MMKSKDDFESYIDRTNVIKNTTKTPAKTNSQTIKKQTFEEVIGIPKNLDKPKEIITENVKKKIDTSKQQEEIVNSIIKSNKEKKIIKPFIENKNPKEDLILSKLIYLENILNGILELLPKIVNESTQFENINNKLIMIEESINNINTKKKPVEIAVNRDNTGKIVSATAILE